MKTEEQETGNYVVSKKHVKELARKVNAPSDIKKDDERLKNTNLVKENQQLREGLKHEELHYEVLAKNVFKGLLDKIKVKTAFCSTGNSPMYVKKKDRPWTVLFN